MLKTIRNAWSIPDLRKKLLFTLMIIIVFRIGSVIPVPFLDMSALATAMNGMNEGNTMLAYLNTFCNGRYTLHQQLNYYAAPHCCNSSS